MGEDGCVMRYLYDNKLDLVMHVLAGLKNVPITNSRQGGSMCFDLFDNRTDGGVNISCYFPKSQYDTLSIAFNTEYLDKDTGGFQNKHEHDNDSWFNIQIGGNEKDDFADIMLDVGSLLRGDWLCLTPKEYADLMKAIVDRIKRRFFDG